MSADNRSSELGQLHLAIDNCRVCSSFVTPLQKPTGLVRGTIAPVMFVGQAPGSSELAARKAFAGNSGRKLDEWLIGCGAPANDPRSSFYFTSVIKCLAPSDRELPRMAQHCGRFLSRQLEIVQPRLVVSLGGFAFSHLNFTPHSYAQARCHSYATQDYLLLPPHGAAFTLLVWPHPSGRNRWLNEPDNAAALAATFAIVRSHTTAEG